MSQSVSLSSQIQLIIIEVIRNLELLLTVNETQAVCIAVIKHYHTLSLSQCLSQ